MQNDNFQTSDWYLTCWLIANQFKVKEVNKQDLRRCVFIFEEAAELQSSVNEFWKGGNIDVQNFIAAIKKAKALLHADSF